MKNKQFIAPLIVLAVLLIGGGIWALSAHSNKSQNSVTQANTNQATTTQSTSTPVVSNPIAPKSVSVSTAPAVTATSPIRVLPPKISSVVVTSLSPATGPIGTLVTIHGTGFTSGNNLILFGTSSGRTYENGTPDNAYASTASSNGTTLIFQIPRSTPSGKLCTMSGNCSTVTSVPLSPGTYPIDVVNSNGTSNSESYTLTQ